jgi:hypothetical protein
MSLEKTFKLSGQKERLQDPHRGIDRLDPFYGCKGPNQLPLPPSTGIQSFSRPSIDQQDARGGPTTFFVFRNLQDGRLGDLQLPPFPVKSTQMVRINSYGEGRLYCFPGVTRQKA